MPGRSFRIFACLWTLGSFAACTVTNIEEHADPLDAGLPDVTVPDPGLPDGALPDVAAPGDDATLPSDAGPRPDASAKDGSAADAGFDATPTPDCGSAPVLRPPLDGSIFCPFSAPQGQPPLRCAPTDECCETPEEAGVLGTCDPKGAACAVPGSTRWECQDTANCGAGQVCCAVGADGGALGYNPVGACGIPFLSSFDGTRCLAACPVGAMQMCESQASCRSGTCTPLRSRGVEFGICN